MEKFSEGYFDTIGAYWEKYIENDEPLPDNLDTIRPEILDSWRRSKEYGISPFEVKVPDIKKIELDYILKKNRTLIQISHSHMQKLYFYVKGTNFAFALVEKNGTVIDFLADDSLIKEQAHSSGLEIGCSRSEKSVGTSGIAICLAKEKPYAVYEKEHFIKSHHNYVCCAAPIFTSEEKLIGCLALIGPSDLAPAHTLGMVIAAAGGIEKELRLKVAYEELSKTNNKLQFTLNSLNSGILLISSSGFITQHNKSADDMLGFSYDLSNTHIDELFTDENIVNEILSSNKNILNREVTIKRSGKKDLKLMLDAVYNETNSSDIILKLERAKEIHRLVNKISGFRASFTFNTIIGNSAPMQEAKKLGHLAAKTDSTVLLLGESGVGKDIFAQAIHNASARCDGPFIAINCASLPKSLIESELFGYEDGAFTGAKKNGNPGKFELAEGGTIFLDEIGDMPLELQATLLRVLQNKEIVRIGGKHAKPVNVRIIAATNTDLINAVKNKQFRSDLFYRINVLSIEIPPLRERTEDIPLLVEHFIEVHNYNFNHSSVLFHPEIMNRFYNYSWPGNVRELENITERAMIMEEDDSFDMNLIMNTLPVKSSNILPEPDSLAEHKLPDNISNMKSASSSNSLSSLPVDSDHLSPSQEQHLITALLREEHGHVATVAAKMNMQKRTLYRKLKKYNINLKEYQKW